MARLSNLAIREAYQSGAFQSNPEPRWEHEDKNGRGLPDVASIPLRLGRKLVMPKKGAKLVWDPREERSPEWWQRNGVEMMLKEGESFLLEPGIIVLGETLEWITFPIRRGREWDASKGRHIRLPTLMGHLDGRTQHGARMGLLVHSTAPNIWPGSDHRLACELIAVGGIAIELVCGYPYFQLSLERIYGKIHEVPSRTNGQKSPTGEHSHRRRPGIHTDAVVFRRGAAAAAHDDTVVTLADAREKHRRRTRR